MNRWTEKLLGVILIFLLSGLLQPAMLLAQQAPAEAPAQTEPAQPQAQPQTAQPQRRRWRSNQFGPRRSPQERPPLKLGNLAAMQHHDRRVLRLRQRSNVKFDHS